MSPNRIFVVVLRNLHSRLILHFSIFVDVFPQAVPLGFFFGRERSVQCFILGNRRICQLHFLRVNLLLKIHIYSFFKIHIRSVNIY